MPPDNVKLFTSGFTAKKVKVSQIFSGKEKNSQQQWRAAAQYILVNSKGDLQIRTIILLESPCLSLADLFTQSDTQAQHTHPVDQQPGV